MAAPSPAKVQKLPFPIEKASMVPAVPPESLPWGNFHRLYGVDGRYPNSIRSFPGFRNIPYSGSSAKNTTYYLDSSNDPILVPSATYPNSVVQQGDKVYYFQEGATPKYGDRSITSAVMGCGAAQYADQISSAYSLFTSGADEPSGGYLHYRGVYGFAFRFVTNDTTVTPPRRVESALTEPYYYYMTGYSGNSWRIDLTMNGTELETNGSYTHVQVYRTVNLASAFDTFNGGIFFLEQEIAAASAGTITLGLLPDTALAQQPVYDPWADPQLPPEKSGAAAYYNGCIFTGLYNRPGFQWTNPLSEKTEQFSANCIYTGEVGEGVAKKMFVVGDYLYIFCEHSIFRVYGQGASFMVTKMIDHVVPVSWNAVCPVGNNFFMVTDQGLLFVNGSTFEFTQIADGDAVYFSDWASYHDLYCAYDSFYGCICILNPYHNQVMLIWIANNSVSLIDNVSFATCTTAPGIQNNTPGGGVRVTDTGTVRAVFDGEWVLGPENVGGLVTTLAPSTAASGDELTPSTSCFTIALGDDTLVGLPAYLVSGTRRGFLGLITSAKTTPAGTGNGYTYWYSPGLADNIGVTRVPVGSTVYVGWKHIKMVLPTIKPKNTINFERVHIKAAQILMSAVPKGSTRGTLIGTIPYAIDAVVSWHRNGTTQTSQHFLPLSLDPTETIGNLTLDGISLYPVIELWNPGTGLLELCGFLFHVIASFSDRAGPNDA